MVLRWHLVPEGLCQANVQGREVGQGTFQEMLFLGPSAVVGNRFAVNAHHACNRAIFLAGCRPTHHSVNVYGVQSPVTHDGLLGSTKCLEHTRRERRLLVAQWPSMGDDTWPIMARRSATVSQVKAGHSK